LCTDEYLLHPNAFPSRDAWCDARVTVTKQRLAAVAGEHPLILVNPWPLLREPARVMIQQEFPQWCGAERTADWHTRFGPVVDVYRHLAKLVLPGAGA